MGNFLTCLGTSNQKNKEKVKASVSSRKDDVDGGKNESSITQNEESANYHTDQKSNINRSKSEGLTQDIVIHHNGQGEDISNVDTRPKDTSDNTVRGRESVNEFAFSGDTTDIRHIDSVLTVYDGHQDQKENSETSSINQYQTSKESGDGEEKSVELISTDRIIVYTSCDIQANLNGAILETKDYVPDFHNGGINEKRENECSVKLKGDNSVTEEREETSTTLQYFETTLNQGEIDENRQKEHYDMLKTVKPSPENNERTASLVQSIDYQKSTFTSSTIKESIDISKTLIQTADEKQVRELIKSHETDERRSLKDEETLPIVETNDCSAKSNLGSDPERSNPDNLDSVFDVINITRDKCFREGISVELKTKDMSFDQFPNCNYNGSSELVHVQSERKENRTIILENFQVSNKAKPFVTDFLCNSEIDDHENDILKTTNDDEYRDDKEVGSAQGVMEYHHDSIKEEGTCFGDAFGFSETTVPADCFNTADIVKDDNVAKPCLETVLGRYEDIGGFTEKIPLSKDILTKSEYEEPEDYILKTTVLGQCSNEENEGRQDSEEGEIFPNENRGNSGTVEGEDDILVTAEIVQCSNDVKLSSHCVGDKDQDKQDMNEKETLPADSLVIEKSELEDDVLITKDIADYGKDETVFSQETLENNHDHPDIEKENSLCDEENGIESCVLKTLDVVKGDHQVVTEKY